MVKPLTVNEWMEMMLQILEDRYLGPGKLITMLEGYCAVDDYEYKLTLLNQCRAALREVDPSFYQSSHHFDEVHHVFLDAAEEIEDQMDEALEEEDEEDLSFLEYEEEEEKEEEEEDFWSTSWEDLIEDDDKDEDEEEAEEG